MASWRELAAAAAAKAPEKAEAAPRDDWGLKPALADALRRLEGLPPPLRIKDRDAWQRTVADALRLARDGWASNAIALGWAAADLYGIGRQNSGEWDALATWLEGRRVAALTEWSARTTCGDTFYREEYMRPNSPRIRPVWLWDFGRQA